MRTLQIIFILTVIIFTSCKKDIDGCTDMAALNFNPEATVSDGNCQYLRDKVIGNWNATKMLFNEDDVLDSGIITSVDAAFFQNGRTKWTVSNGEEVNASWEVEDEELLLNLDSDSYRICDDLDYRFEILFNSNDLLILTSVCEINTNLNFEFERM